jgi:hypothetical protein
MTMTVRYPTIIMIVEMTIQNPTMSLFGHHPWKQWASSNQNIPSSQHLETRSPHLNLLLRQRDTYILSVRRTILSWKRRMNSTWHHWHPRSYLIKRLNDWIRPLMYTFTRGRIQAKPVSNCLHEKLDISVDMSPLVVMWQASSLAQNTTPRQHFQVFRWWSLHM